MKQFYYTYCYKGCSISGNAGSQVRAVSQDTNLSLVNKAIKYSAYQLSYSFTSNQLTQYPVKLVYLKLDKNHFCAIHSCFVNITQKDIDEGANPWGTFFTHGIVNLDKDITAKDVISSWGSPFWVVKDPDPLNPLELQEIDHLPDNGTLNHSNFDDENNQNSQMLLDGLEFIMNAFLSMKRYQKIIVAGKPQDFAQILFGLCTCLPNKMLRNLTFSTFEQSSKACPAKINCVLMLSDTDPDPIDFAYNNKACIGLNLINNKRSKLNHTFEYTCFVKNMLSMDSIQNIHQFCSICDQYDVQTGEQIEMFFRFYQENTAISFGEEMTYPLIKDRQLLHFVMSKNHWIEWFIGLALKSEAFIIGAFAIAISHLTEFQKQIVQQVLYEIAKKAVINNNIKELSTIIEKICVVFPKGTDRYLLNNLLIDLSKNSSAIDIQQVYQWEIRSYLLTKWSYVYKEEKWNEDYLKLWLLVPPFEIHKLFSLKLERNLFATAIICFIEKYGVSIEIKSYLIEYNFALDSIVYFCNNKQIGKAHEVYQCVKKSRNFSSLLFLQLINDKETFNDNKEVDDKRLELIKTIASFMDDLPANEIFLIFSGNIIWNKSSQSINPVEYMNFFSVFDFLLKYLIDETILKKWIQIFLHNPTKDWLLRNGYENILKKIRFSEFTDARYNQYIERWLHLYNLLKNIEQPNKNLGEIRELFMILSKTNDVNDIELKKALIEIMGNRLEMYSVIKKSRRRLILQLTNELGVLLSGSKKQFLFDLTNVFKSKENFYHVKNVQFIADIILSLTKFSPKQNKDNEVDQYIIQLLITIIEQKNKKLNSMLLRLIRSSMLASSLFEQAKTKITEKN